MPQPEYIADISIEREYQTVIIGWNMPIEKNVLRWVSKFGPSIELRVFTDPFLNFDNPALNSSIANSVSTSSRQGSISASINLIAGSFGPQYTEVKELSDPRFQFGWFVDAHKRKYLRISLSLPEIDFPEAGAWFLRMDLPVKSNTMLNADVKVEVQLGCKVKRKYCKEYGRIELLRRDVSDETSFEVVTPKSSSTQMMGRTKEIHELNKLLQRRGRTNQITVIYGLRGVGKTTLAEAIFYTNQTRFNYSRFFYLDGNFSLERLYKWIIGAEAARELVEQGRRQVARVIAEEISQRSMLLVFDGCEQFLDMKESTTIHSDPDFGELIDVLADYDLNESRVILTGWQLFRTKSGKSLVGYHLGGLDKRSGAKLLRSCGVKATASSIARCVEALEGHPQIIIWLAALVVPVSIMSLEEACSDIQDPEHGEIALNVLGKIYEILSPTECLVLMNLSIFYEMPSLDGILFICAQDISSVETHKAIAKLARLALIRITEVKKVLLDDLVKEYISHRCGDMRQQHAKLAKWYLAQAAVSESWQSREDAYPTYYAVQHFIAADLAEEAMKLIKQKGGFGVKLTQYGMHLERIAIVEELLAGAELTWKPDEFDEAWLLRLAGFSYAARGEYEKGEQLLLRARLLLNNPDKLSKDQSAESLVVCINALRQSALWRNNYPKAIELHESALQIARIYNVKRAELFTVTDLAEANIAVYYQAREQLFLHQAITWAETALNSSDANRDCRIRASACIADANAWLGNKNSAYKAARFVLTESERSENIYSQIQALRSVAICSLANDNELFAMCMARAEGLCSALKYEIGHKMNSAIFEAMSRDTARILMDEQRRYRRLSHQKLDEAILRHLPTG